MSKKTIALSTMLLSVLLVLITVETVTGRGLLEEQMYKGMWKTIPQSEESSNSTSTLMDYYKDKMIQGMAEQTTEQSGLGLAQMLYEQMKRNYGLDTVEPDAVE